MEQNEEGNALEDTTTARKRNHKKGKDRIMCDSASSCALPPSVALDGENLYRTREDMLQIDKLRKSGEMETHPSLEPPLRNLRGRITVFTISGCPHCRGVKAFFGEQGLPFFEINLDIYPNRRREMFERTGLRTVPQVFFNDVHVGGNDRVRELFTTGELQPLVALLEKEPAPPDAPEPPNDDHHHHHEALSVEQRFQDELGGLLECEPDSDAMLVDRMRSSSGLVQNRIWHLRKYRKCFIGREAVDWLLSPASGLSLQSREEAVEFGNKLMANHYLHHVTHDHSFRDDFHFYRFLQDEDVSAVALNTVHASSCIARSAAEVGEELRHLILAIYDDFLSADGKGVDYEGLGKSEAFKLYIAKSTELQRVDLSSLSREETMAFFINVYNAMVIHAYVQVGAPTSVLQRYRFFNKVTYLIGGHPFSLNDIEHGILRGNRKPPGGFSRQFSRSDARLPFCIRDPDPRVHFALVCGAKSCPAIKTYRAMDLEGALVGAAETFFGDDGGLVLNVAKREVKLSRILDWYRNDFAHSNEELLRWVASFVHTDTANILRSWAEDGNFKITFLKYDWRANTK